MSNQKLGLVSVIAVCYNHEKYLEETLNSIKNQTYANIELIIMDDYSTDNSVEKIREWIDLNNYTCKFIHHNKNQGLCKTLNEAINLCKGEYLQLTSCDDILLENKIKNQIDIFNSLEDKYGVVYSDGTFINEYSQEMDINFISYHTKNRPKIKLSGHIFDELILGNFIPAMSVLMKKKVIEKIGKYDERLSYEDFDFWLRVAKSFHFYYIDKITVKYRMHSENLHKKITKNQWREDSILIGLKHIDNLYFFTKLKTEIIQIYFVSNNRKVINQFYHSVPFKQLDKKITHFCIKNNFPKIIVKILNRLQF